MRRPKKGPKLAPNELRDLIEEYNIVFDGPIRSTRWPAQYAEIFQRIYDIDWLRYEDEDERISAVLRHRVLELTSAAYTCRNLRENEATWRAHIEHLIFPHFNARAASTHEDTDILIVDRCGWRVIHDPADRLSDRGLGDQEPDRIFGLQSKSITGYTAHQKDIRHSPFVDGKVLYPFLIVEAKSEKGSTGFDSVESQTAFPIRLLVNLQQSLKDSSGIQLSPLVWFMSNQGDDWRVYAGISEGPTIRVIHLWSGTILSETSAMQLLLISDYISDWVHDTYAPSILRCLSARSYPMREPILSFTAISSQEGELTDIVPGPITMIHDAHTPPIVDLTLDSEVDEAAMDDASFLGDDRENISKGKSTDEHPLLRFSGRSHVSTHWSKHATIRHSNFVLFSFRHFAIPESRPDLETWLNSFSNRDDSASYLLELLSEKNTITITEEALYLLQNLWMNSDYPAPPAIDHEVRARITFHTYLRSEDWQVVRELSCVTASRRAWKLLSEFGKMCDPLVRTNVQWMAHRCPCLTADKNILRSLSGSKSATIAMSNISFVLRLTSNEEDVAHFDWSEISSDHEEYAFGHYLGFRSLSKLEQLPYGRPAPKFLRSLLANQRKIGRHGAALLRKPDSWPAVCPTYCLMVFDDSNFEDEPALSRKISKVFTTGDVYVIRGIGDRRAIFTKSDESAIRLWVEILEGKQSPNTEWPRLETADQPI